ncbi:hypothetical protein ACFE04_017246 [Oxalis oulophora]
MEWSAKSATNAYLDTLQLCDDSNEGLDSLKIKEPGSNEFISALAAGMKAKLIVEVTSTVSPSTIALATAAKHTGGKFVCIIPEPVLAESKKVIKDSGFKENIVEFKTGDPLTLLPKYENIEFSLVDCKNDDYPRLLNMLDVNPRKAVVVANNLVADKTGLEGFVSGMKDKVHNAEVRSVKHLIGKGMEVTTIGKNNSNENQKRDFELISRGLNVKKASNPSRARFGKSKWVMKVDEESGEEHIYRHWFFHIEKSSPLVNLQEDFAAAINQMKYSEHVYPNMVLEFLDISHA